MVASPETTETRLCHTPMIVLTKEEEQRRREEKMVWVRKCVRVRTRRDITATLHAISLYPFQ